MSSGRVAKYQYINKEQQMMTWQDLHHSE
ncbi:GNAT family N-acetyltransferase, partial [Klebsiella pneumoniae]